MSKENLVVLPKPSSNEVRAGSSSNQNIPPAHETITYQEAVCRYADMVAKPDYFSEDDTLYRTRRQITKQPEYRELQQDQTEENLMTRTGKVYIDSARFPITLEEFLSLPFYQPILQRAFAINVDLDSCTTDRDRQSCQKRIGNYSNKTGLPTSFFTSQAAYDMVDELYRRHNPQ